VAAKPHSAVVKFDMYRNLQRHHAILRAIAWFLLLFGTADSADFVDKSFQH